MARYARMSLPDGEGVRTVEEMIDVISIEGRFHPDVAQHFVGNIPNATVIGSTKQGSTWTHPDQVQPEEPEPSYRKKLSRPEFKLQFTTAERLAISAARAYAGDNTGELQRKAVLDDFYGIIEDPALEWVDLSYPATIEGINYLAGEGLIQADRVDQVLTGIAE